MYQETQQLYQLWRLAIQERDEAREQLMHSLAELSQLRELLNTILLSKEKIRSYYLEPADESTGHQNFSYNLFPGDSPSNFSVNSSPLDLSVLSNQMRFVVENMRDYETVVLEMIGGVLPENGKFLRAVSEAGSLVESLFVAGPVPKWINPPVLSSHITANWNYGGLEFGSGFQNRCHASV
ncbi:hypothetical protein F2Q69_00045139 [Brassica cretica]|uniref:Uncharacterized protein n=3 Tax=Brassica TaxID=3705 RepID=A0A0D3EGM1_BRAOL|nr:PREDICTED: uncharacterized protein LOC106317567 [Brassica oleracea var. oleracea]KAF3503793.1 hypothetical protein F2Q69_00045139 [Brassica cretica]VDD34200.1 unnamed protein product [Brassica oleracea]